MVGIAQAYLSGECDLEDPRCSPLLAQGSQHFALPPTLVHACQNELLLDDAESFVDKCRGAGVDVTLHAYEAALHAWHTFFPIMPVAEEAVQEVLHSHFPLHSPLPTIPCTHPFLPSLALTPSYHPLQVLHFFRLHLFGSASLTSVKEADDE